MKVFSMDQSLKWLFCFTHPDDEISICAWIHRLTRNGNSVYLSWTHSTPIREKEARIVAEILGVPNDHLFFFHATDGSVCDSIADLVPRFRNFIDQIAPDRVCCGAFEQGHIDHDATNYIVNCAYAGPVLEIPFYHTYLTRFQKFNRFSDPRGEEILQLDLDDQRLKKEVARHYPSQNIWHVLLLYEAFQGTQFRRPALAKSERMRFQTHRCFYKPSHPPVLARRIKRSPIWRRWRAALRVAKKADSSRRATL